MLLIITADDALPRALVHAPRGRKWPSGKRRLHIEHQNTHTSTQHYHNSRADSHGDTHLLICSLAHTQAWVGYLIASAMLLIITAVMLYYANPFKRPEDFAKDREKAEREAQNTHR